MIDIGKTQKATSKKLVEQYIEVGEQQFDAEIWEDIDKYSALFKIRTEISEELKSRPGDHRKLLLPLFNHENLRTRQNAIENAYIFDPAAARKSLIEVTGMYDNIYSPEASMTLDDLDSGFWVPD